MEVASDDAHATEALTDDDGTEVHGVRLTDPGRGGQLLQVSVAILAVLALIVALREARLFMMPTVLGGLIALTLTPLCALIDRLRVPMAVSAMLVTISLFVAIGAVGWFMLPSLDEWRYRAPEVALTLERKLRRLETKVEEVTETAAAVAPDMSSGAKEASPDPNAADGAADAPADATNAETNAAPEEPEGPAEKIVEGGRKMVTDIVASAPEILGALAYSFFLIFFLMAERDRVRRWAMMMGTNRNQATRIGRTLLDIRRTVGLYLATISLINLGLGVATATTFYLIDMPAPILWGAFMFVMNFMPYLGPLIVQACAFAVGFVSFETTTEAFYPVAILLILNTIEGQLITPMVLGSRISVSPLAVFMAVTFGAWMWGPVGAIVATPALIVGSGFLTLWFREAQRQKREAHAEAVAVSPSGAEQQAAE